MAILWPAVGSFASAAGSLYLLWELRTRWDKPGAKWFVATIATVTVWCTTYGVALLVDDVLLRRALEMVTWLCLVWIGYFFVVFALGYTGRKRTVGRRGIGALALLPVGASLLVLTNPLHALLWDGFRIVSVYGVSAVEYRFLPLGRGVILVGMLLVTFATALLLDTVASYGPLYRREALAVGLSPIPPGVGVLLWGLGVGPALNFTTILFLPHVAADLYAFVRSDMFEFDPATRRAGERAAIDDIATPVVVVDRDGRVVTLNPAAEGMLAVDKRDVLTRELDPLLGEASFAAGESSGQIHLTTDGRRRTYKHRQTELRGADDALLGHTVVFQDISKEIRRERRLSVLNRFLRHNVRNEGVVIQARAELLAEELDGEPAGHARTIGAAVDRLVDSGDKARTLSEASGSAADHEPVGLRELAEDVVGDLSGEYGGTVEVRVPPELTVRTDPALLDVTIRNLVGNALQHVTDPVVEVRATTDEAGVRLSVSDDGPGLPDHEQAVIERGEETALDHGSGMGLWLVDWATTTLGGDVQFDTTEGTTVTVRLPAADEAALRTT